MLIVHIEGHLKMKLYSPGEYHECPYGWEKGGGGVIASRGEKGYSRPNIACQASCHSSSRRQLSKSDAQGTDMVAMFFTVEAVHTCDTLWN